MAQAYNTARLRFPTNLFASLFGFKEKPQFTVDDEKAVSKPPAVDFSTPKAAPAK